MTVLDIVLKNNPELQQKVLKAAVDQYPVIGPQLQGSIGHLSQKGIALAVAAIGIFIGALGVSNSLQNALNSAWEIPFARRPGFPWSALRSAALIIVIGVGFIGTTIIFRARGRMHPWAGSLVPAVADGLASGFGVGVVGGGRGRSVRRGRRGRAGGGAGGRRSRPPAGPDAGADVLGRTGKRGASCRQAAMTTRLPTWSALPPRPLRSTK